MFSTAAIDEKEAEEHLKQAYRMAGLEPVPVRWFDSPIAFIHAYFSLIDWDQVGVQVRDQVRDQVGVQVWDQVGDQVRDQVWVQVRDQVWDQVWDQVGDQVRDQVWDQVGDQVGVQVRDQVGVQVWVQVGVQVGASVQSYLDENWHSFYRFFHEVFEENDLIHLALFNEMVSGFRLGSKEAWLVRKPTRLERDERGRLHSADGMCMQYQDGWGFYAWHGVRCSEKLIMHPEQLSREDWLQESNLELRRAIQERVGSDRFVELIGGRIVDTGQRGELIAVDLRDDPERVAHFVHVICPSTARQYYLRVPATTTRADAAVAWTYELEENAYQPVQET